MQATSVGPRLSAMMFLQFFIWGSWYVSVSIFMDAHGMADSIFWAYTVGPIAALVSPFFLGLIADRLFATEKVLGVMHLLGAVFMFAAPWAAGQSDTALIIVLLLHMLCYMPTLGLTNTLAFHNIGSQEKHFPIIRMFGTIGWIVANLLIDGVLHAKADAMQFWVAGFGCVALSIYSFSLPHTPPPAKGKKPTFREIIGLDALKRLASVPYFIFLGCSFLICIPLAGYYSYGSLFVGAAGFEDPVRTMSYGQIAEVVFIFLMPWFFLRLGVKWMLTIGMMAWVARYGLFALGAPGGVAWMIVGGIVLHGICYDFFFVTGQIYTDKKATPEIRGQAQGFLVLLTQGAGMLIGAQVLGPIFNSTVGGEGDALRASYQGFWIVPCVMAGIVMLVFLFTFFDRSADAKRN